METLPYSSINAWRSARRSHDLHPALTFYRFMELDDTGDYQECLKDLPARTSISFAPAMAKRLEDQTRWLEAHGCWKTKSFRATLATRMAVGMGIPSVTENGLYLDHTLGIPVIPGSVLKGVAQDYALLQSDALQDTAENQRYKRETADFVAVFGAQTPDPLDEHFRAREGQVIFFDAFPTEDTNPFEIDIMNPHYGAYYSSKGEIPPADYLDPNPILFLTVKTEITFRFALAARAKPFSLMRENGTNGTSFQLTSAALLAKALEYLKGALFELGVGGKTRVGYGLFRPGGGR